MSGDLRRIEVIDDAMADVLRRKTPTERLAIGFGLWRSAQKLLRGQLASLHPEWDSERLNREVARRLSHGAV
jgi:Rv0078B-related antitoxin